MLDSFLGRGREMPPPTTYLGEMYNTGYNGYNGYQYDNQNYTYNQSNYNDNNQYYYNENNHYTSHHTNSNNNNNNTTLLTRDEIEQVAQVLNVSSMDLKAAGPVRLYRYRPSAEQQQSGDGWSFTGYSGIAAVLVEQQQYHSVFIVVVDLKRRLMVLSQECYLNFDYQELSTRMHAFEGDDAIYGLLFDEYFDANAFATTVKGLMALYNREEEYPLHHHQQQQYHHPIQNSDGGYLNYNNNEKMARHSYQQEQQSSYGKQ